VSDDVEILATKDICHLHHVSDRMWDAIRLNLYWPRSRGVATLVRSNSAIAHVSQNGELVAPLERALRKAVQQKHQRPVLGSRCDRFEHELSRLDLHVLEP
jgi:hypothetical protein